MQFLISKFIYTPSYYGGWLNWFYGFIITGLLIESFAYFFLFQKETRIHLPLWIYLVFLGPVSIYHDYLILCSLTSCF